MGRGYNLYCHPSSILLSPPALWAERRKHGIGGSCAGGFQPRCLKGQWFPQWVPTLATGCGGAGSLSISAVLRGGMPSESLQVRSIVSLNECVPQLSGVHLGCPLFRSWSPGSSGHMSIPLHTTSPSPPSPPWRWCMSGTLRTGCTVSADLGEDPFLGGKLDGAVL